MRIPVVFHGFAAAGLIALGACSSGSSNVGGASAVPMLPQDLVSTQQAAAIFVPEATATPVPVAYVTSYYTTTTGNVTTYHTQINAFNTLTNAFVGTPIASVAGLPEGATLSGDGKILYVTEPIVSASQQSNGTLYAYTVTPTSAMLVGSLSYAPGSFGLAYARTTGPTTYSDVFVDSSSGAKFSLDTNALMQKKSAPSDSTFVEYAYAMSTGSAYVVDRAGIFHIYNAATNTYGKAITGLTNSLPPGEPVLAVLPNQSKVYGLIVNRTGSGSTTVDVINPNGPTLTKQIGIGFPCFELLADNKGTTVYAIGEMIVNGVPVFDVAVIATASDTVTKTFALPDSTLRSTPFVAVSTDSVHLLVTAGTGSGNVSTSLDVVDPLSAKLVAKVALPLGPGKAPVQAAQVVTAH